MRAEVDEIPSGAGTATAEELPEVTRGQVLTATMASVVAWAFDLFDLFIILFVASTIGPILFPSGNATLELAAVYASFAVTLVMRPVGSAIFGSMADRHGRKRAMVIGVTGVGIVTALMGAVPTYAATGLLAPILFVALRLVQGIFVGGIVASTHTLGTETVPARYRGMLSGLIGGGGAGIGAMVAATFYLIVSAVFPGDAFSEWGWRVMFFTGALGALFSFLIFRKVEESPIFKRMQSMPAPKTTPVRELFSREYRSIFLLNLLVVSGGATMYYLTSGFLPTFLGKNVKLAPTDMALVLIVASLVVVISATLAGHVSELIGRRKTFVAIGAVNIGVLPLIYLQMKNLSPDDMGSIIGLSVLLAFFANAAYAPVLIFLNERFPTRIRATGTAVSWNVGFALGGMTPTLVTGVSPTVNDFPEVLAIVLVAASVIYLIGAAVVPETRGHFEDA
jgi:MHS family proline/betaine transporter-like MFS transporter